jgi:hypothetical protein
MRQGPHIKRGRGRGGSSSSNNNRRSGTPNRNQAFDSNGPEVRIRGNANQVNEKYLNLARDAAASGDRVLAESYFQHAEHYFRILSAFVEEPSADANRNRDSGSAQGYDNNGDGSQFREGDPQPEFGRGAPDSPPRRVPSPTQSLPPSENERAVVPVTTVPSVTAPVVEVMTAVSVRGETQPAEVLASAVESSDDRANIEATPKRRLSTRPRRSGVARPVEPQAAGADDVDSAETSGVTVTVVGAPASDPSDAPVSPPRPRRRPRVVAPTRVEEEPPNE